MQLLKTWWFTAVLGTLLTLVSVYHGSFAGYPVAALMWADFIAWMLVSFGGLYACTLTGGDRKQVFAWLMRFARLAERVPLRWYHRVFIAGVMWGAGWKLTALVSLLAVFQRDMLRPELKRATA